jgi:hypothetical protein
MLALLTRSNCNRRLTGSAATRNRNEAITINPRLSLNAFFMKTMLLSFLAITLENRAMRRSVTDLATISALETQKVRTDHFATRSVAHEVRIGVRTTSIDADGAERSLSECTSLTTMKA